MKRLRSAGLAVCLCGVAAGHLPGCVGAPPDLDPGRLAADAAGLHEAIMFTPGPEPLDVPGAAPDLLTPARAAELAVRHSPEVQAALADVRAALAEAQRARLLANPILTLALRLPTGGAQTTLDAGLSQPLIELLQRPGRSAAADARLRAATQMAVIAALDAVHGAETSVAILAAAEAQRAVRQRQRELMDRLLQLGEDRLAAGETTGLDVAGFRARQTALRVDVLNADAQVQAARLDLARRIGRPSSRAEFAVEASGKGSVPEDEAACIAWALRARPELQAAGFELVALGAQMRLARSDGWDGLEAGVDSETEDSELAWGPALALPIPIFDVGQERRTHARARVTAAQHRLTGERRRVVLEVRQAFALARAAAETEALIRDALIPLEQDRLDQTRAAYEAGFASVNDALLVERDLLDAQARQIDAACRRRTAAADLRRATGGTMSHEPEPGVVTP